MCAFPNPLSKPAERFRVTRAKPGGNAVKSAGRGAENSAATASIAGAIGPSGTQNPWLYWAFYWAFCDGTAFADALAVKVNGRHAAFVGVLPCCLLLALCRPHWMLCNR